MASGLLGPRDLLCILWSEMPLMDAGRSDTGMAAQAGLQKVREKQQHPWLFLHAGRKVAGEGSGVQSRSLRGLRPPPTPSSCFRFAVQL